MDAMSFGMLLKRKGVKLYKEVDGRSIAEILGFISEETQKKLANTELSHELIEELLMDSMKSSGIKNTDSEIRARLNDADYMERLKSKYTG